MPPNHPLAAVILEAVIDEKDIQIPHNRIHRILREEGLAKNEVRPHRSLKFNVLETPQQVFVREMK